MIWIVGFIAFWVIAFFVVDAMLSAPRYKGPKSDHFNGRKFGHPYHTKGRALIDVIKWSLTGDRGEWTQITEQSNYPAPPPQATSDEIAVTFVNHSTFLIQVEGLNILTDPVWSNRASPYSWIGPKRMRPPGLQLDDLPEIDMVLLSHNHYDHLDLPTILQLTKRFDPYFVTSLGIKPFLHKNGIGKVSELDWWDEYTFNDKLTITGTPAKHFSGRGVLDRDKTLWCGFMLQAGGKTIYFVGDTAYGNFFTKIGDRFPNIDLSFIPIGAYKPQWFMSPIHCNPDEAVHIHQDVKSARSIAMHFGTFPLADEGQNEPLCDLAKARKQHAVQDDAFIALKEGKTHHLHVSRLMEHREKN